MEKAVITIAIMALAMLTMALLVVWSRRDIPWIRGTSILAAVLLTLASAVSVSYIIGYAAPVVSGVTAPPGKFNILGVKLVPNEAIYILIDIPDQPRLYWFPWDKNFAERIQKAMEEGETMGLEAEIEINDSFGDFTQAPRVTTPVLEPSPPKPRPENPLHLTIEDAQNGP